jgi:endoplasmic reticulum-Golgi intermediate compartment protein 2
MGYAVRIGSHAIDVVTGADKTPGIVAAEATGAGRKKFVGADLRSRVTRQGNGWNVDGGSPYGSYAGTPVTGGFSSPGSPYFGTGNGNTTPSVTGLGLNSPSFGPEASPRTPASPFPTAATMGSPYTGASSPYLPTGNGAASPPQTAGLYAHFPPTPNPVNGSGAGFPHAPVPGSATFAPPPRANGPKQHGSGSVAGASKKDD